MTAHGLCIFTVHLRDGERRSDETFNRSGMINDDSTALDELMDAFASWGSDVYYGRFSMPTNENDLAAMSTMRRNLKGEKAARLLHATKINDHRIDLRFEHGTSGSHEIAISSSGSDDLSRKAPGNTFRASLLIADDHSMGVLIAQSRGRSCPAPSILRLASIAMRRDLIRSGSPDLRRFWSLVTNRVAFTGRLEQIVRHGSVRELELIKYSVSSAGKRLPTKDVTITQKGIKASFAEAAKERMLGWLEGRVDTGDNTNDRQRELVEASTMIEVEVTPDDYDEVGFIVEAPDGTRKSVSPSSIADMYIFPSDSDLAVGSNDELIRQAAPHLVSLPTTQGIDLDL